MTPYVQAMEYDKFDDWFEGWVKNLPYYKKPEFPIVGDRRNTTFAIFAEPLLLFCGLGREERDLQGELINGPKLFVVVFQDHAARVVLEPISWGVAEALNRSATYAVSDMLNRFRRRREIIAKAIAQEEGIDGKGDWLKFITPDVGRRAIQEITADFVAEVR